MRFIREGTTVMPGRMTQEEERAELKEEKEVWKRQEGQSDSQAKQERDLNQDQEMERQAAEKQEENENEEKPKDEMEKKELDVNERTSGGLTALYTTCSLGLIGPLRALLSCRGIDVNRPDNDGRSPLLAACWNGQAGVVEVMSRDVRVDPNRIDRDHQTALWVACFREDQRMVETLLASGRAVHAKEVSTTYYTTALQEAGLRKAHLVIGLVQDYLRDPGSVRLALRRKLCWDGGSFFPSFFPFPLPSYSFLFLLKNKRISLLWCFFYLMLILS